MKKRQSHFAVVGGSSLLVIFAVLCLVVLALLSLSSAQAEQRLADASLAAITDYYRADSRAEAIYAQLRCGQLPEGVERSGSRYTYRVPISDAQELVAAVEHRNGTWTVLQWQAVSTDREENESAHAVWPGPQ